MSVFQKAIVLGLTAQVILLLCGGAYFGLLLSNNTDGTNVVGTTGVMRHALQFWHPDSAAGGVRGGVAIAASTAAASSGHHHPLTAMIQSYAPPGHDPTQRRQCFAFTAVPNEIERLLQHVHTILHYDRYAQVIDCIHLSIPHRALRFGSENYPTTAELQRRITDPRIILHRLFDYGPMTRYIGPLAYEQHPDTSIVIFDMDSENMMGALPKDLVALFHAARFLDPSAMWCLQGENFVVEYGRVKPAWDTFPSHFTNDLEWNLVHFCRGVGGLLFKPHQFGGFWYNQSEYHESCFWDDDRWVGYQMERLGVPLKVVHAPKAKLLDIQPLIDENKRGRLSQNRRLEGSESNGREWTDALQDLPQLFARWANDTTARAKVATPVRQGRRRRLGSLTQITNSLHSDQTCPLAWLQHHPDAFPTAQKGKAAAAGTGRRQLVDSANTADPERSFVVKPPPVDAPDWNLVTRNEATGAFQLRRKGRLDGLIGAAANKAVDDDDDDDAGQRQDITGSVQ